MVEKQPESSYEDKEIRCPKLGGPVTFGYCRIEDIGRPCFRAITCWEDHFAVEALFRDSMSKEEFDKCFSRPPPSKVGTLLELIEKAKKLSEDKQE